MAWMLENDKVSTGATQYSTDNSDKGSSHKRSHKSGSSLHKRCVYDVVDSCLHVLTVTVVDSCFACVDSDSC